MEIEHELTLSDYLLTFKRRWKQILTVFLLTMVAITIVTFLLPEVYESEGVITIEAPTISKDVVDQTIKANYFDERIDKVIAKVLSKDNLANINKKYNLLPGLADTKKVSEILNTMVKVTKVSKKKSNSEWDNNKVTVGLIVGFQYSDPEITHKIAKELVALFLDENAKARTKRVTETTEYLADELNRMKTDLENVENLVADYKQKNANSLPEHQQLHMASLDRLTAHIKSLDRDYKNAQEELRYLDVELTTTSATLRNTTTDGKVITISALDKAKAELDRSLILYKETHPTVRALKRKVSLLEQADQLPTEKKPVKTNIVAELAIAKINTQIGAAKARLDSISAQKQTAVSKMNGLQSQIVKIPQVERGLFTLLRDYENAKRKYEDVKAKQINAKIAENLELENKAERFILTESPEFPEYRISPVRTKIVSLGFFGALGLGFVFALLLEMLDKRVRGQAALASIIDMRPLAVIPYVQTSAELTKKRNLIKSIRIFSIVSFILLILIACVHFFVVPLNTLISEIL